MLERPSLDRTPIQPTLPTTLGIWRETDAFLTARQAMISARDEAISRWVHDWFARAWARAIDGRLWVKPWLHDQTPWTKVEPANFADDSGCQWHPSVRAMWKAEEPHMVTFEPNGMLPDGRLHHGNSRGLVSTRAEMMTPAVVGRLSLRWRADPTSIHVSPMIAPPR